MARPILVEIFGDASQFNREMNKATTTSQKFGRVATVVGGLLATGIAIGLEKSVKAAINAEAAQARLTQSFHNAGLSLSDYTDEIDKAEAAGRRLGFTDEDVKNSLGSLITATHNVTASIRDLAVAQDIARFKHVSLTDATKMLTMAMTGSQRAAKQLGITVIPTSEAVDRLKASHVDLTTATGRAELAQAKLQDKMATGQAVIDAVTAKTRGQAQAFSETAQGGMAQFTAQLDHLEVMIGQAVLPALTELTRELASLTDTFTTRLSPAVNMARSAFDRLNIGGVNLGTVFLELANPITRTKLVIEGLTVAVHAGESAFNALRNAATSVSSFFTGVLHGAMNTIHTAASTVDTAVSGIADAFRSVRNAGDTLASWLEGGASHALNGFRTVVNGVKAVIDALASALRYAESAAHSLASALSSIHVPSIHFPSIPGVGHGIPFVPGHAAGGIVTRPHLAMVGEAGPEAIIPLNKTIGMGAGGMNVYVTVQGALVGSSVQEVADTIRRELLRVSKRTGGVGLA